MLLFNSKLQQLVVLAYPPVWLMTLLVRIIEQQNCAMQLQTIDGDNCIGNNVELQQIQTNKMRKPKTYVLDEEQHLENLRKIIKRDFFASQSHHPNQRQQEAISMSLNDYIRNFKSNQNQIFTELVKGDAEEWKKKHQWMERAKHFMIQSGSQSKPFTNMLSKDPKLKSIDYSVIKQDARNAIFFNPDAQTKSYNNPEHDRVKKVLYDNCQIQASQIQRAKIYDSKQIRDPNLQQIPATPVLQGRGDSKHAKFNKSEYSMKRVPSPEPQKLPIMTWGQVESTPFRIQPNYQPDYKIPQKSQRDKLLQELTSKIIKQKMIKKNKKQEMKTKILSSIRGGASSYRKQSMARQNSEKRQVKRQETGRMLDNLLVRKK